LLTVLQTVSRQHRASLCIVPLMTRICIAVSILLLPAVAHAQWRRCEPPSGVGAAVGLLTLDAPLDPALAGVGRPGRAKTTGTGIEASVHAMSPIGRSWGVTIEAASGRMATAAQGEAPGKRLYRRTEYDAAFRRIAAGLLKAHGYDRACTYVGVKAGFYRYSYRGVALNARGGSAMMGFELPASDSGALFFELELSVGLTRMRRPLASDPVAVNIRPSFGFRHRF
jgi:hypothetical protein